MDKINRFLTYINKLGGVKFLLFTNVITLSLLLSVWKDGGYTHKVKVKIGMAEAPVKPDTGL